MIDYIIPFVDCSDIKWQNVYSQYADDIIDNGRWKDWGILKYQLRSIEKYMTFVDRIFIILSIGDSQIPEWLNTDNPKIKIIYDYEFVPKDVLPVFNSNVIELYFPRIKELSEHYLTACDDYLLMRPFTKEEFFSNDGKIKLKLEESILDNNIYGKTIENSVKLINPNGVVKKDGKIKCLWANHTITPHIKSVNEQFLKEHEQEIYNSLSKERQSQNLTWLIYPLNAQSLGLLENGTINVQCKKINNNESIYNLQFDSKDILVLNDWYDDFGIDIVKQILINKMNNVFPDKSQFEK